MTRSISLLALAKRRASLGALLDRLAAEGFALPENYPAVAAELLAGQAGPDLPWYVRLFVGLSAWIAAILLIAFLFLFDFVRMLDSALVLGPIFCALAAGLARRREERSDFLDQLALVGSLAGQGLFLAGLYVHNFDNTIYDYNPTNIALGMIGLELVLLAAYPSRLHRFISTLVILGAGLTILIDQDAIRLVHGLIFALAVGFVALNAFDLRLRVRGLDELAQPVMHATAFFFLGLLVLPWLAYYDLDWRITALLLAAVLLALGLAILWEQGLTFWPAVWLVGGCALLLVPAMRMPGILAALIVLFAGFWRNQRVLLGLAAAALAAYLSAYYYNLTWTLLVKSLVLMVTGVILLGLRALMQRYGQAGGEA